MPTAPSNRWAVGGGQILVTDQGSTNGTLVNGRSVNRHVTVSTPCTVEVTPFTLVLRRERDDPPTETLRPRVPAERAALSLDPEVDCIRLYDGREVLGLTPIQHQILLSLIERFPAAIGAGEEAAVVSSTGSLQALYTQIGELRSRLDEAALGARELIRSRRSFGYSIAPAPASDPATG
jgi:FHA domain